MQTMPNLMNPKTLSCGIVTAMSLSVGHVFAEAAFSPDEAAELAQKLNNRVPALISVPIQANSMFPKIESTDFLPHPTPESHHETPT